MDLRLILAGLKADLQARRSHLIAVAETHHVSHLSVTIDSAHDP